jgi:hypothetical protein
MVLPVNCSKTNNKCVFYRQAEYLHSIAKKYESIYAYGIDHWWIGLTDAGRYMN